MGEGEAGGERLGLGVGLMPPPDGPKADGWRYWVFREPTGDIVYWNPWAESYESPAEAMGAGE